MKALEIKTDFSMFWDFAKSLILIMGILLFFMGWIYLNSFLSYFGLSLTFIKIEIATFYFYGFFVLIKFWSLLLFFLFFVIYYLIYYYRSKLTKYYYFEIIFVTILLFSVMYFKSMNLGNNKAEKILYKRESLNPIRFNFKDFQTIKDTAKIKKDSLLYFKDKYFSKMLYLNYKGKLYFLLENDEEIIVFHNPNKINYLKGLDNSVEIYKIRKETIDYYYLSVDISNIR